MNIKNKSLNIIMCDDELPDHYISYHTDNYPKEASLYIVTYNGKDTNLHNRLSNIISKLCIIETFMIPKEEQILILPILDIASKQEKISYFADKDKISIYKKLGFIDCIHILLGDTIQQLYIEIDNNIADTCIVWQ